MTTTWEDFRDGLLRSVLGDLKDPNRQDLAPTFDDDLLLSLANAALSVLSREVGPIQVVSWEGDGQTTAFNLPTDYVASITVMDHQQNLVKPMSADSSFNLRGVGSNQAQPGFLLHWPTTRKITFLRPIPSDVSYSMRYRAFWPQITGDEYVMSFGIWDWLALALALYVSYLAYTAEAGKRALLEQWATRPELQVDNPLEQQAEYFFRQYDRLIHAHNPA